MKKLIILALLLAASLHPAHAQVGQCTVHAGAGTGKALATVPAAGTSIEACVAAIPKPGDYTLKVKATKLAAPVVTPPVVTPPAVNWVLVGPEKAAYTLPGRYKVRFGTGTGVWSVRVIDGSFSCGTTLFGDPAPGAAKRCERESATTTDPVTAPSVEPPVVTPPVIVPPVDPVPTVPPITSPGVGGVPSKDKFADFPAVGQITATAGQVIERVRISTTSGPCIIVAVPNVTVRDVLIGPCGPGEPGKGLDVRSGASNLTVQGAYFEDISTALYANGAAHPIIFDRNYVTKIRGPMPRGQMVQLNNVKGGAGKSRVTCNVGDVQGLPNTYRNVEDWLNFYSTGGVEVAYNRLRGGGYQGYNGNPPSGTAVLFGDAAGGTDAWVHDNRFVGMTNVGIGVAGGVGARIERNQIHMVAAESGNYTNVGIYVAKYSSGACSGHSVTDNRVRVVKADGSLNPRFFASASDTSYCGTVNVGSPDSNVWNDTTLDPAAMFNTVPAECQ